MNKKINLQLFGAIGVFPVHNNVFKINTAGRDTSSAETLVTIKDLETFSLSIDGNTEEWKPMDQAGWARRAITGKGLTISFTGKRHYGDVGNDYIAGLLLATGQDAESVLVWEMPNGDKLTVNCVINLTAPAGGDSTNIDALEFEVLSDGLPEYTPSESALGTLTFECSAGTELGTQIEAVSPVVGVGNSYAYKINGALPAGGADVFELGFASYTLGEDIDTVEGNNITLVEIVTGTGLAVKGGIAPAVTD